MSEKKEKKEKCNLCGHELQTKSLGGFGSVPEKICTNPKCPSKEKSKASW